MTATMSGNGHVSTRERVRQVLDDHDGNITATEIGERLGIPRETAGYHKRKLAAVSGEPAAVSPAARPSPAGPVRTVTKVTHQSRQRRDPIKIATWLKVIAIMAVVVVTGVAALLSYSGLRQLAIAAGLGWHADILPLAVDGLVAVCLLVRIVDPGNGVARLAMWLALVASVAANAYAYGHPWDTPLLIIAASMAGFMPITAGVGYHLLGRMLR